MKAVSCKGDGGRVGDVGPCDISLLLSCPIEPCEASSVLHKFTGGYLNVVERGSCFH